MSAHQLRRTPGLFRRLFEQLLPLDVDFGALRENDFEPVLWRHARQVWTERLQTEFRSIQVMNRFLGEVLASGDPLDVYAGAADAVLDEIRHTALCHGMVMALGGDPTLPDPLLEDENPEFLALPMPQRALGTAVSMLAVSETLSIGFIEDLRERCQHPVVRGVLDATLGDEDMHQAFGWAYVEASLARFDASALEFARAAAEVTLAPHLEGAEHTLAALPEPKRHLDAWPEAGLASLGLHSPERQALVCLSTYRERLAPRLRALAILPGTEHSIRSPS